MKGNDAVEPEQVAATIAVWWDMHDCPVPEGYDPRQVRPSIERKLKKRGFSDPVSITAYGDQKQAPDQLLRGLSSTGVVVTHVNSEGTCNVMFKDMLEWLARNPPGATMMLISNQVKDIFNWDLTQLQQEAGFNLCLAWSRSCRTDLLVRGEWLWRKLLGPAYREIICSVTGELSAKFCCKLCNFDAQSLETFRNHLSTFMHEFHEIKNPWPRELNHVTAKMYGRNYDAKPEHATAKISVWWDMIGCPIPEGYNPRRVRPSMEGAFKNLGYSGPVSITAYADLKQTPEHILRGLSSTGVDVAHSIFYSRRKCLSSDLREWQDLNPPPATIMVIADDLESMGLLHDQLSALIYDPLRTKYNLFLAYTHRPYKMPVLVTSAEWLWESLLQAGVCLCSHHPETRRQSVGMGYCKSYEFDCKGPDKLIKHLSGEDHAEQEALINEDIECHEWEQDESIMALIKRPNFRENMEYRLNFPENMENMPNFPENRENRPNFPKSKPSRKVFRTGFRPFHNHLRPTSRRARRR